MSFDFKEIERKAEEDARIREQHLKYIAEISSESKPIQSEKVRELSAIDRLWYNGNDTSNKPNPIAEASEQIMNQNHFVTVEETKDILYYKDGVYLQGGEIIIEKAVERLYGYELNNGLISEIKGHIRRRTYHKREEFDANINIINLSNGLYDIETNELTPHRPDYLSLNQKPIVYNKYARPKLFGKFLSEVLKPLDIRTALEAMAYTFHRDYPIELIFILHGVGSNGKSVYTSTLTRLHGDDNVSNIPLNTLLYQRFGLSGLENKDVNVDNELVTG